MKTIMMMSTMVKKITIKSMEGKAEATKISKGEVGIMKRPSIERKRSLELEKFLTILV